MLELSEKVIATFVSASANNLSLIKVEVTFFPSVPAKGESLTVIVTAIVGGSMGVDFIAVSRDKSQIVSATEVLASPATHIISPGKTSLTGTLLSPSNLRSFVNLPFSILSPFRLIDFTISFTFAEPCSTLPTRHLPKYGSESSKVTNIANGNSWFT